MRPGCTFEQERENGRSYQGAVCAVLQVVYPHGLRLLKDAKLAQMVSDQMSESVEGYSGVSKSSESF